MCKKCKGTQKDKKDEEDLIRKVFFMWNRLKPLRFLEILGVLIYNNKQRYI